MTVALSAAVQMMVFSKAAGVMFTVDLVTGNDNNILIEGSWGLGEYVVQGTVTPDNFRVDKAKMEITDRMINDKNIRLVRKADGDCVEEVVPADEAKQQVITDAQVLELAEYAKAIENIMVATWIWNGSGARKMTDDYKRNRVTEEGTG